MRVLGPAEAPLALVRGRFRFRLLVKSPRAFDLSAYLRGWLAHAPRTRGPLKLEVDVDPQSFCDATIHQTQYWPTSASEPDADVVHRSD